MLVWIIDKCTVHSFACRRQKRSLPATGDFVMSHRRVRTTWNQLKKYCSLPQMRHRPLTAVVKGTDAAPGCLLPCRPSGVCWKLRMHTSQSCCPLRSLPFDIGSANARHTNAQDLAACILPATYHWQGDLTWMGQCVAFHMRALGKQTSSALPATT